MPTKLKDPFEEVKKKFKENDLAEIWRRMKAEGLGVLQQEHGAKARQNLEKQFDKGLGPLLDQWAREAGDPVRTPRSDRERTHDQIRWTIASYRSSIKGFGWGGRAPMVLDGTLKHLDEELERQVEWYRGAGLW